MAVLRCYKGYVHKTTKYNGSVNANVDVTYNSTVSLNASDQNDGYDVTREHMVIGFNTSALPAGAVVSTSTFIWTINSSSTTSVGGSIGGQYANIGYGGTGQKSVSSAGLLTTAEVYPDPWGNVTIDNNPYLDITYTIPNSAPYTPTITTPNWHIFNTPNPTFTWNFSDPDGGDYQTAYWVDLFDSTNTVVLSSTGWVSSGTGSHTITGLGNGHFHFRVYTRDKASVQSPYGVIGFIVDTIGPVGNAREATRYANTSPLRVYVDNISDNIAGVGYVDAYMLNLAQNAWVYQGRATGTGNSTWYFDYPVGNEGQGTRLTRFHAVDNVGNQGAGMDCLVYYDTIIPTIASGQATQYLNVAANGTFRVIVYGVDGGVSGINRVQFPTWTALNWQDDLAGDWPGNATLSGINAGGGTWYYDVPLSLHNNEEGHYLTHVYAFDNAGNMSPGHTIDTYIDRTSPIITGITPLTYTKVSTTRMQITGVSDSVTGVGRVDAYILNFDGSTWSGPYVATDAGGGTWYYDFNAAYQGDGQHSVRFWVYDKAGNGAYKDSTIVYDTSLPVIGSGDGSRYSNQNSGTIRHTVGNTSDATSGILRAEFYWSKSVNNGSTWTTDIQLAGVNSGTSWYCDIPISGDGYYSVDVHLVDRAGNYSAVYPMLTTVDSVLSADPNPQVVYEQTTATFTWNAFSDPNPSSGYKETRIYFDRWNGTAWVSEPTSGVIYTTNPAVLSKSVTGLIAGARYKYTVAHFDNAGNQSSFTYKEFITKKKIGERKVELVASIITLPIYDPASGVLGSKDYRVKCTNDIGCYELVTTNAASASPEHINTTQGIRAIAKI